MSKYPADPKARGPEAFAGPVIDAFETVRGDYSYHMGLSGHRFATEADALFAARCAYWRVEVFEYRVLGTWGWHGYRPQAKEYPDRDVALAAAIDAQSSLRVRP